MSLVGPRPHAVGMKTGDVESAKLVAEYAHRHRMKPGMTGWAAIKGSRGPVDTPELVKRRVALDIEYIERQSLMLDLCIMAMTIPCLLGDDDERWCADVLARRRRLPADEHRAGRWSGLFSIVVFTRAAVAGRLRRLCAGLLGDDASATRCCFTWMEAAMARFYAPEAEGGRLADHFATLYRCWLRRGGRVRRRSPALALLALAGRRAAEDRRRRRPRRDPGAQPRQAEPGAPPRRRRRARRGADGHGARRSAASPSAPA